MPGELNRARSNPRRWLYPVVVLLIGGAIAWWASSRETRRINDIQQIITNLCRDISYGADVSERLDQATGAPNPRLEAELRRVCPPPAKFSSLEVHVTPGDAGSGTYQGLATHSAIVRVHGIELLGLRIRYRDSQGPLEILGYFKPSIS